MMLSAINRIRRDALDINHRASAGKLNELELKRELIKSTKHLADGGGR